MNMDQGLCGEMVSLEVGITSPMISLSLYLVGYDIIEFVLGWYYITYDIIEFVLGWLYYNLILMKE